MWEYVWEYAKRTLKTKRRKKNTKGSPLDLKPTKPTQTEIAGRSVQAMEAPRGDPQGGGVTSDELRLHRELLSDSLRAFSQAFINPFFNPFFDDEALSPIGVRKVRPSPFFLLALPAASPGSPVGLSHLPFRVLLSVPFAAHSTDGMPTPSTLSAGRVVCCSAHCSSA